VSRLFDGYQFGEAGRQLYDFFWAEFADWYVEIAKQQIAEGGDRAAYTAFLLVRTLDSVLRMLHPFTPFVTEELWGHLKHAAEAHSEFLAPKGGWEDALIIARWPEAEQRAEGASSAIDSFHQVQDIVRAIRNARAEKDVNPGRRIAASIVVSDERYAMLQEQKAIIASLAHLDADQFEILSEISEKLEEAISLVVSGIEIYIPLAGLVDREAEKARLGKELTMLESQIIRLEKMLSSEFATKAPEAVVEKERTKLETYQLSKAKIKDQLKEF